MKQLVVISGKGGTGKTSVVASFASLAKKKVLADCDVDAADLHLVLEPTIISQQDFFGGSLARIDPELCAACGQCQEVCRFEAVSCNGPANEGVDKTYSVDPIACDGCGLCHLVCPADAIIFEPVVNGQWYVSQTRHGPMAHAKLGIAEENSGKLVTLVRQQAKELAERDNLDLVIIDGPPGIGCPVIASITGADLVLVVTEPTLSGLHDLERVADLTKHFGIKTFLCMNKWDLNRDVASQIEAQATERGIGLAGKIRYDRAVTDAQIRRLSLVEYENNGAADEIKQLWAEILQAMSALESSDAGGLP